MIITVSIPSSLRSLVGGARTIGAGGETVGEVLSGLATRYPEFGRQVYLETGELRRFVNVFVNTMNVRELGGVGTPVTAADTITIVPAIAGG